MSTKQNPGKFDCYASAEPDEPMFVLLARDPLAPALVRLWASLRALEGGFPPLKADEAAIVSYEMERWKEHQHDDSRVAQKARERLKLVEAQQKADDERLALAEAFRREVVDKLHVVRNLDLDSTYGRFVFKQCEDFLTDLFAQQPVPRQSARVGEPTVRCAETHVDASTRPENTSGYGPKWYRSDYAEKLIADLADATDRAERSKRELVKERVFRQHAESSIVSAKCAGDDFAAGNISAHKLAEVLGVADTRAFCAMAASHYDPADCPAPTLKLQLADANELIAKQKEILRLYGEDLKERVRALKEDEIDEYLGG